MQYPEITKAECERLLAEADRQASTLAANQCHHGYGTDYGDHRCKYQDEIDRLQKLIDRLRKQQGNFAMTNATDLDTALDEAVIDALWIHERIKESPAVFDPDITANIHLRLGKICGTLIRAKGK